MINVDWIPNLTEEIDGEIIPITYNGIGHYYRVEEMERPHTFEAIAFYKGIVKEKIPMYIYEIKYEKILKNHSILPKAAIITAIDTIIIVLILIFRKNCTIYNKTEKGLVKLKKYRLTKNTKQIDLSNLEHKINTNIFVVKVSKCYFKKHKNQQLKIKRGKLEKKLILYDLYNEIIID